MVAALEKTALNASSPAIAAGLARTAGGRRLLALLITLGVAGSAFAAVAWLIGSAGFSWYVANFGRKSSSAIARIGLGMRICSGVSSLRRSCPASSSRTRCAGSSDSRAARVAPAEPPPMTIVSYSPSSGGISWPR